MFFCGAIYDPVDPEYTPFCVASVMEPEGIDCMTLVWFDIVLWHEIINRNLQSVISAHSNSTTDVALIPFNILIIGHMPIGVHFHVAITSMKNESASQWKGSSINICTFDYG